MIPVIPEKTIDTMRIVEIRVGVMVTRDDILAALRGVRDPELGGDVVELGMVKDVDVAPDGRVHIGLALTIAECPLRGQITDDVQRRVRALPGVTDVEISTSAMTADERANLMSIARRRAREHARPTQVSPTTRVAAIASGKGGVGKSSISANLAVALARQGRRVGLLDADIWGFSLPRILGTTERLHADDDTRLIIPAEVHGLKLISTGLIAESEDTALMWRGLMLSKALEQFLTQVDWGELDYLVIDMPPGTGDVQMALSRMLPQAEMVVVTTPQVAAQKVAMRVADMARRSHMPVVGVIENMSWFECGHGERYALFGEGGGETLATELAVPLIGKVPIDPAVVDAGDRGRPVVLGDGPAAEALAAAAARLTELLPPAAEETCTGRIARLLEDLDRTAAG